MHPRREKTPQDLKNYSKIQHQKCKIHNDGVQQKITRHAKKKENAVHSQENHLVNRNRFRVLDDSISKQATISVQVVDESIITMKREMEGIKWTQLNF